MLATWLGGFVLYHWLHPVAGWPDWWQDVVRHIEPVETSFGASLPTFAATVAVAAAVAALERRVSPRSALSRT